MSAKAHLPGRPARAARLGVASAAGLGRALGVGVLLGAGLGGCGFDTGGPAVVPANTCTLVDDCLSGTCLEGVCVEPTPEALRVFLQVEPQADAVRTLPARWRFAPELVVGPGELDLALPLGVEVVGQVRLAGVTVPADLAFTRIQEFPVGSEDALRTRTYAEPTSVEVNGSLFDADFVSVLGGGGVYDVSVTPTTAPFALVGSLLEPTTANRVVPPLLLRHVAVPSDTSRWELAVNIEDFSAPCSDEVRVACTLTGDVVRANELGVDVMENGLLVRAIELESERVVSSLGVTAEGRFAIAIAQDAGPYLLRISAGADRPLFPEVTTPVTYADDGWLRVEVPAFAQVVYAGTVETAEGLPLADAQVHFRGTTLVDPVSGLSVSLQRTVVTGSGDSAGEFELSLLPGAYDVIVTPASVPTADPLDEPGILAQRVELSADVRDVRGQLLVVPRRANVAAQIWTPAGEALPLDVDAIPLRREGSQGLVARFNRSATASAGPTGWFALRLDLGLYDIIARPPAVSAYPWVVIPGFSVSIPGSTSSRMIDIGLPVPRSGVVRDSEGVPVAGARVTAYVLLQDVVGERAVPVAETTSDAEGFYRLLLPSRLEPAR